MAPEVKEGAVSAGAAVVHLAAAASFALGQPLLEVLGRDAPFFVVRRTAPVDLALFLSALFLLPPLFAALSVLALGRLRPALGRAALVTWIGSFATLAAAPVVARAGDLAPVAAVLLSLLAGVLCAWAYARRPAVRSLFGLLGVAPLVFSALFLLRPGIARIAFHSDPDLEPIQGLDTRTELVFVILDELSLGSLIDERFEIDADLFPNFARLAGESVWFRNATTVHGNTILAVPSLLTGSLSDDLEALPNFRDHPRSLFTLFGASHRMNVTETVTRLCPPELMAGGVPAPGLLQRLRSLVSDTTIVLGHVLIPRAWARGLPPVTRTWSNFGQQKHNPYTDRRAILDAFLAALGDARRVADPRPRLSFLHLALPHVPWVFLPDGRRYVTTNQRELPGVEDEVWVGEPWLTSFGLQRHLLQAGYADRCLGELLDRLDAVDFDGVLVVVADHGLAFEPGFHRRDPAPETARDIAHVPLFVRRPDRLGRIDDRNVESTDLLPTIAEALSVAVPWEIQGRSAFASDPPTRPFKSLLTYAGERLELDPLRPASLPLVERKRALFAPLASFEDVYAPVSARALVGRPVEVLAAGLPLPGRLVLEGGSRRGPVRADDELVPAFLEGTFDGVAPEFLAVAVNGTVQAVVETFERDDASASFVAVVDPTAYRDGPNRIDLFGRDPAGDWRPLAADRFRPVLEADGRLRAFERSDGLAGGDAEPISIVRGTERGTLARAERDGNNISLSGWALAPERDEPAESVLLWVRGSAEVFVGSLGVHRPLLEKLSPAAAWSGFRYELPASFLGPEPAASLRAFGLHGDEAHELVFAKKALWLHATD